MGKEKPLQAQCLQGIWQRPTMIFVKRTIPTYLRRSNGLLQPAALLETDPPSGNKGQYDRRRHDTESANLHHQKNHGLTKWSPCRSCIAYYQSVTQTADVAVNRQSKKAGRAFNTAGKRRREQKRANQYHRQKYGLCFRMARTFLIDTACVLERRHKNVHRLCGLD